MSATTIITSLDPVKESDNKLFVSIRDIALKEKISIPEELKDIFIYTKYSENLDIFGSIVGYLTVMVNQHNFNTKVIFLKNKITLHEFLFAYFQDPFKFIQISAEDHESINSSLATRVSYYFVMRVIYKIVRENPRYNTFKQSWVEDDKKFIDLFHEKTYIYLPNLCSNNVLAFNVKKSIEAITKGITDLTRITNYALTTLIEYFFEAECFSPALFVDIPEITNISLPSTKKAILNYCFGHKTTHLPHIHNIKLNGCSLIVYLANYVFDESLNSKLSLNEEQKKQLRGYMNQIFCFTSLKFIGSYHGYGLSVDKCFKSFEQTKANFNTCEMFFSDLNLVKEKFSHRNYKKIIELLNQIIKYFPSELYDSTVYFSK